MATREVTIPRAVLGPTTAPGLPRSRKSRGPGLLALVLVNLLAAGFLGGAFGALAVFPIIERGLFEQRLHEAKLATQLVAERLARLDEAALTPEAVAAATSRLMVDTQMVRWWSNVGPGPEPLTSALRWTPGADELRMTGRAMQSGQPQSRIAGPASTFGLSHPQGERVAQVAVLVTGRIGARGEAGVVIAEFSLEAVEALVRRIFRSVAAVFAVAWFLVLSLAIWLLSRSVAAPLAAIASTARAVTGGDSSRRASLRGPREVGEVAEALNVMLDAEAAQLERRERQVADLIRANRDLREARAEVLRGETLASLGRLASGVAHEIGNPLGAIIGYTDLLRDDRLTPAERNDYLDRMQGDLGRIRATIRQLLDLARPSSGEASAIDVVEAIRGTADLARLERRLAQVTIDLSPLDGLPEPVVGVFAEANRLRQVFLNLFLNAGDALADRVANDELARVVVRLDSPEPGQVRVTVEDNGPGISPEHLAKLFTPFFTTKKPGQGTGLGLSVCQQMMQGWGGRILAGTTAGPAANASTGAEAATGARFELWFRAAALPAQPGPRSTEPRSPAPRSNAP